MNTCDTTWHAGQPVKAKYLVYVSGRDADGTYRAYPFACCARHLAKVVDLTAGLRAGNEQVTVRVEH